MKNSLLFLCSLVLLISCEPEFAEEAIFNGRWKASRITTEHYHLGELKKTDVKENLGFIELIDSSWVGDEINQMWIDSQLITAIVPFHRLDSLNVVEQVSADVYSSYWKADPAKYRFYINAFLGANSSVEIVNLTLVGGKMTWVYFEDKGEMPYTLTTKQTIEFTRQ